MKMGVRSTDDNTKKTSNSAIDNTPQLEHNEMAWFVHL